MGADGRPRRSVLYMPGSNERALEKAKTLAADGLILDLEDAVVPAEKENARWNVASAVAEGGYGRREVVVRVNGLDTDWVSGDLAAVAQSAPDAVLIPKIDSAAMVREADVRLKQAGAPDRVAIWAMIETPLGMLSAAEIAAASPRLACFVMGTNDLVKDLGAQHTPDRLPVLTGLGLSLLAARAYGLSILDGVYNAVKDEAQLRVECEQGRTMGFDGKTLIHPTQISVANDVFAPSPDQVAEAERQVAGFAEAEAAGKGVAVVDGKIVEALHVQTAKALLARAAAIEAMAG